jgi:hypothetical protein
MGLVLGATYNCSLCGSVGKRRVVRHLWLLFTLADDNVGRKYVL